LIKALIFDLGNTLMIEGDPLGSVQPFPEVQQVLYALKKRYKLALITNVPSAITVEYVHAGLRELGIHRYFDVVIVSSAVGCNKPHEQIFTLALDQLDVKPEEAMMIGNTIATDIFGGNRIGMTTILIQRTEQYQPSEWEQPNHTISSLTELLSLLEPQ
jgi:putative hydrolase of the HAD superfamily